jgi:hypothetical protein
MHWSYHGRDREKPLLIASEFVSSGLKTSKSYEAMKGELERILDVIFEAQ